MKLLSIAAVIAAKIWHKENVCGGSTASWWSLLSDGVSSDINISATCIYSNLFSSFLVDLPSGAVFVVCSVALRAVEGVGWTMSAVSTLALVPNLFPSHIGTVTVSN